MSVAAVTARLISALPMGWAFGRRGGVLDTVLAAIAAPVADAERSAAELMDELDPRLAVLLLPDFERVLGPDPCGRDLGDLTIDQRQRLAHQRWTARGGQSIPYFIGLAAALGVAIEIEEDWPSVAGGLEAGDELVAEGEQFTWAVRLELIGEWDFEAGGNVAGDPLGGLTLSDVECLFRRLKPAHTHVVFSYIEPAEPEEEE